MPEATFKPALWRKAIDVIRRDPPPFKPVFMHRDFHPGNVLFVGEGSGLEVDGVVDWVETSWGPADLDVAHCSTAIAFLVGTHQSKIFVDNYLACSGTLADDHNDRLYWRMLDALAFAPDAEKVAVPWRELGHRSDRAVLTARLERHLETLLERVGNLSSCAMPR